MTRVGLACWLMWSWWTLGARAQSSEPVTVVLVPPHAEAGISDGVVTRAMEALRRQLEQSAERFRVITAGQAAQLAEIELEKMHEQPKGERPTESCLSVECAAWFRSLTNADLAAQLALFNEVDAQKRLRAGSIKLTLVESTRAHWVASATLRGQTIEQAIGSAAGQALDARAKGVGPWISVVGAPEGAEVFLDHERIGMLPLERTRITDADSLHVLTVKAEGYRDFTTTLDLRGDASRDEVIQVNLSQTSLADASLTDSEDDAAWPLPPPPPGRVWPAWQDWVLGGSLIAAATAVSVNPLRTLKTHGDCFDDDCARTVEFGRRSIGLSVAGGVLAMAGVAVLGWRPFAKAELALDRHTAMLRWRGSFGGTR